MRTEVMLTNIYTYGLRAPDPVVISGVLRFRRKLIAHLLAVYQYTVSTISTYVALSSKILFCRLKYFSL